MHAWTRFAVDDTNRSSARVSAAAAVIERLDRCELHAVRWLARARRRPGLGDVARALSWLGSGWLYLVLSTLVAGSSGWQALRAVGTSSAMAVAACFAVYGVVKPAVRRVRPYIRDPSLETGDSPLDRYAFPSGHSMTAAAVGLVLASAVPGLNLLLLALWLAIGWSRIVLGHHYPSDVIAGGALGALVAWSLVPVLP